MFSVLLRLLSLLRKAEQALELDTHPAELAMVNEGCPNHAAHD
jgi:hypothetical protein